MKLITLFIFLWQHAHIGVATIFSADDQYNPDPRLGCNGQMMDDTAYVVAHPSYPCKTKLAIYNLRNDKYTIAIVMDRGPRHALIDLSPAVANKIKANGMEMVIILPVGPGEMKIK